MNHLYTRLLSLALFLTLLFCGHAFAESEIVFEGDDLEEVWILDDPEFFMWEDEETGELMDWDAYYDAYVHQEIDEYDAPEEADGSESEDNQPQPVAASESVEDEEPIEQTEPKEMPVITSVGRSNVKVHGVKSKNTLLPYTIPSELLESDPNFAALMIEADKYIGYPYVYGASNPKEGFDCSGFICWVFIHSGVYDTNRRGANGLHSLCKEIEPENIHPGDLVFFQGTMGPEVKGITHCGIYIGNHMMIHAGDPVGFADLNDEKWAKRFVCYGRLPY